MSQPCWNPATGENQPHQTSPSTTNTIQLKPALPNPTAFAANNPLSFSPCLYISLSETLDCSVLHNLDHNHNQPTHHRLHFYRQSLSIPSLACPCFAYYPFLSNYPLFPGYCLPRCDATITALSSRGRALSHYHFLPERSTHV